MSVAIVMPQLGLTMEEGTVSGWLKKTGDAVAKNDLIFSVSTDKVEMDVEAVVDGTMGQIIVQAGETVPVGTVLAYVEGAGEDLDTFVKERPPIDTPSVTAAKSSASTPPSTTLEEACQNSSPRDRQASPRAKRLAKELGVDLAGVRGPGGEITEKDIRNSAASGGKASPPDSRRQRIAERLTLSVQTIPTFSIAAEVNAEKLLALHESLSASIAQEAGIKLTVTDLLLAAFARALKSSPEVNSTWDNDKLRAHTSVDLGLAVATPRGVIAPVLRNLESTDLRSLVKRRSELVEKSRSGRLALTDLEGGVGTLSNLGMYRVDHFQAIISPGQSSILAIGQIRQRPWVENILTVKPTVMLNLTVDHRVTDGAAAAVFLGKLIELIEEPQSLSATPSGIPSDGTGRRYNV